MTAQRNGGITLAVSALSHRHYALRQVDGCASKRLASSSTGRASSFMLPKKRLLSPAVCSRSSQQSSLFSGYHRRYPSVARLPLLFPKKPFGFLGTPFNVPLSKGTKALHRKIVISNLHRRRRLRRRQRFSFCIFRSAVYRRILSTRFLLTSFALGDRIFL